MRKKLNLYNAELLRSFIKESILIKEGEAVEDSDGDGVEDAVEVELGTDPKSAESAPTSQKQEEAKATLWKAVFGPDIPTPSNEVVTEYIAHASSVGANASDLTAAAEYLAKVFSELSGTRVPGTQKIAQKAFVDENDLDQIVKDLNKFKEIDAKFPTQAPLVLISLAMGIATADWPWVASPAVTKESLSRRSKRLFEGLERLGLTVAELSPMLDDVIRASFKDLGEAAAISVDDVERLTASGEAALAVNPSTLGVSGTKVSVRAVIDAQVKKGIDKIDLAANEKIRKALLEKIDDVIRSPDANGVYYDNPDSIMQSVETLIKNSENLGDARKALKDVQNTDISAVVDEFMSAIETVANDRVEKVFADPKIARTMASSTLQRVGQTLSTAAPSKASLYAVGRGIRGALWDAKYSLGGLLRRWKRKGIFQAIIDAGLVSLAGAGAGALALVGLYMDDPDLREDLFSDPEAAKAANLLNPENKYCFGNSQGKLNLVKGCKIISYTLRKTIAEARASREGVEEEAEKAAITADIELAMSLSKFFDKIATNVQTGQAINYSDLV